VVTVEIMEGVVHDFADILRSQTIQHYTKGFLLYIYNYIYILIVNLVFLQGDMAIPSIYISFFFVEA
jgi:hypothetical protein